MAHYMEKNKTGFLLIPQLKVNLKGIKDLNISGKTINLRVKKKKKANQLCDTGVKEIF